MDAYLIFGADNAHPFAWMLNKKYRHVWCILADHNANMWVSYNWHQGLPIVRVEAAIDFDIASHYRDQGLLVLNLASLDREAVLGPLILNNCVGHVKSVLGIGGFSLVPNQLLKYVTRSVVNGPLRPPSVMTVPGFGDVAPPLPTTYTDGAPIPGTPLHPISALANAGKPPLKVVNPKTKKGAASPATSDVLVPNTKKTAKLGGGAGGVLTETSSVTNPTLV